MSIANVKGIATCACPLDAPPGAMGFVRDRHDNVHVVALVKLHGVGQAIVRRLDTDEQMTVRRDSLRLQLVGSIYG